VDLHLEADVVGAPVVDRGIDVDLVIDEEGAVRAGPDRPVADVGAERVEVVPVRGEEGIRVLRGRQAGVRGIARALGVAPELEPAVRRDGDRAVARALDRHAERQGGVHGRVVAAERLETRDVRGVDVVRAVGQPGAERHGGPATAGQGGAEEDEEPDHVHGAAPRAAKPRSGPNRVTGHLRPPFFDVTFSAACSSAGFPCHSVRAQCKVKCPPPALAGPPRAGAARGAARRTRQGPAERRDGAGRRVLRPEELGPRATAGRGHAAWRGPASTPCSPNRHRRRSLSRMRTFHSESETSRCR